MKTRNLKTELRLKQKAITRGEGYPGKYEGRDGDISIRYIKGRGLFIFYKWGNKWYSTRMSLYTPQNSERQEAIILPKGRKPRVTGEITLQDGKAHVRHTDKATLGTHQLVGMKNSKKLNIEEFYTERTNTSTSHSTSDYKIINKTGHANLRLETQGSSYDAYVLFCFFTGEVLKQWTFGIDNSDADKMKWDYNSHLTPIIPGSNTKLTLDIAGNLTTAGTLTAGSIVEIGSDTDRFLMHDTNEIKYVTGANLLTYLGIASDEIIDWTVDQGGTNIHAGNYTDTNTTYTGGTNLTLDGTEFNVDDAFIVNNADDTMAGTLTINKDVSSTGAGTYKGLEIDFDKTGTSTSNNNLYGLHIDSDNTTATNGTNIMYGILNTPTLTHNADAGVAAVYGLSQTITGGTNGTGTAGGIINTVTGGDTNFGIFQTVDDGGIDLKLMSSADTADYFTISTTANGATTLETVDAGAAAAHLTLDPDGDLIFDGCDVKLDAGKKIILDGDGGNHTYIYEQLSDTMSFVVGGVTMFQLQNSTTDTVNANTGHFTIDSTYKLYFDGSAVGNTYITESSADVLDIYVGGDKMLSLDESVDTGVTSLIGTLKIAEQADASADTAGYGQLWVDTATPNELAFTDDAGTDIIGIGKYHYETKFVAFYSGATANYLPMNGYIIEKTSTTGNNEYCAFLAPYNGRIEKAGYRSEVAQDGNLSFRVLEATDGTEVPGTMIFRKETAVDIADDTYQELDMTGPGTGSDYSPLTKGRIYMIYLATPSIGYDTNMNVVFRWDITS